ncbi:acyl-CoA dehydrogenase, partial [Aureobasidium melanogenum]
MAQTPNIAPYAEPLWSSRGYSPYHNETHFRLRKEVREYVDNEIIPYAAEWEKTGHIPQEPIKKFADRGYMAASIFPLAAEYLGSLRLPGDIDPSQWDAFHDMVFMDEIARCGYLGVIWGLACGNIIGFPPVINYGTPEQKRRFVPDVLQGKTRFCLGVTEPDAGSDVAGITTTAVREGNIYRVNGSKKWITNGIFADYVTAGVRTGGPGAKGLSVLVIPLKAKGVTCKKMDNSGVNASGSTFIELDDVEVPVENLIGREGQGFEIITSNFNHERIWLACTALRLARLSVRDAYLHAISRETFGKKLIDNQVIRQKLAVSGRKIESTEALLEQLVYIIDAAKRKGNQLPPGIGGLVANAKVLAGNTLEKVNRECQQIMGGQGYNKNGRGALVEQISRDLRVLVVGGGSEEILTDFAVKEEAKLCRKTGSKL